MVGQSARLQPPLRSVPYVFKDRPLRFRFRLCFLLFSLVSFVFSSVSCFLKKICLFLCFFLQKALDEVEIFPHSEDIEERHRTTSSGETLPFFHATNSEVEVSVGSDAASNGPRTSLENVRVIVPTIP